AVDEHHGDATRSERLRERDARGQLGSQEITQEEAPALPAPLRRLAEGPRERGGRPGPGPDLTTVDLDAGLIEGAGGPAGSVKHRLHQLAAGIVDAQQRGHRGPQVRAEEARTLTWRGLDRPRGQRRADPRSPESGPESSHPELGHGHELNELAVGPSQGIG